MVENAPGKKDTSGLSKNNIQFRLECAERELQEVKKEGIGNLDHKFDALAEKVAMREGALPAKKISQALDDILLNSDRYDRIDKYFESTRTDTLNQIDGIRKLLYDIRERSAAYWSAISVDEINDVVELAHSLEVSCNRIERELIEKMVSFEKIFDEFRNERRKVLEKEEASRLHNEKEIDSKLDLVKEFFEVKSGAREHEINELRETTDKEVAELRTTNERALAELKSTNEKALAESKATNEREIAAMKTQRIEDKAAQTQRWIITLIGGVIAFGMGIIMGYLRF